MQKTIGENEIHAIKKHTKLLLLLMLMFNLFNDPNSKTLPTICSHGNALGSMNLIAQMMIHGSCRNIWDGDSEKLIQFVKGYLENRRRAVGCYASRLQNLLQDSALDTLISDLHGFYKKECQCQDKMGPQSSWAGSRPHLHKSCQHVKDSIERGEGLSGIVADKRFFFLVECK